MFIKRFEICRILGFPIRIDMSWFLIVVFFTWILSVTFRERFPDQAPAVHWAMGFAAVMGLFVSVLLHELGHAVVARRCGMRMNGITLFIFGGVAEMQDEPPSPKDEFLVAIGGPIVSVALIGVFGALAAGAAFAGAPPSVVQVLLWLSLINGILVVFNMIPGFPLDGGRVLRAILWHWKKNLRWATKVTSTIGSGFGVFLIVMGVLVFVQGAILPGVFWFAIGMFLRSAAHMAYQQVLVRRALEGEQVRRFMKTQPITVAPDLTIDQLVRDYFYRHYHKMYPVVQDGNVVGCITTRDVKDVPQEQWSAKTVGDLARPCSPDNTIRAGTDAIEALSRMSRNDSSRLMVVDEDGRIAGMIALKDLLRFLSLKIELDEEMGDDGPGRTMGPSDLEPEPVNRLREFEEARR